MFLALICVPWFDLVDGWIKTKTCNCVRETSVHFYDLLFLDSHVHVFVELTYIGVLYLMCKCVNVVL